MVLYCNLRCFAFFWLLGFLDKAAENLIYSYPSECSQEKVLEDGVMGYLNLDCFPLLWVRGAGTYFHCCIHIHPKKRTAFGIWVGLGSWV